MSTYNESCVLCSNATLSDTLLRAEACRFRGNPSPYAALETHLSPISLPSIHTNSFMGASFDREPCHAGDSVASTVLAVCHSVKNLDCVVHVIQGNQMDAPELAEVTSRSLGNKECIVLSVYEPREAGRDSFSMASSSSTTETFVDESAAMQLLMSIKSFSKVLVWYWSTDVLGYSYLLNAEADSMWALSFEPRRLGDDAESLKVMMPSSERSAMRILPFFYPQSDSPAVVAMGTGGVNSFCKADLAVETAALSRIVTDRAYSSSSSGGRCFCCQYLNNLHSSLHFATRSRQETCKLKLSRQFWQKTKGKQDNA